MVHELPALLVLEPLEHRKVDDPEELERRRVEQVLLLRDRAAAAGRAASTSASCWPGRHQQQVVWPRSARFRARCRIVSSPGRLDGETLDGASRVSAPRPGRSPRAASPARRAVELALREYCRGARNDEAAHLAAGRDRVCGTRANSRLAERRRQIADLHARSAGPACRTRTSRSPRRTASAGTAAAPSRPISASSRSHQRLDGREHESSVANDISRSTCVNSGCRSARRSSSRKHLTIWK